MNRPVYLKFLIFCAAAALLWAGLRFLGPIFLPFLLAAFLSLAAEKSVGWMHRQLHLPRPLASLVGVGGVFVLLMTLLVLVMASLMRQVPRLMDFLPHLEQAVLSGRQLLQQRLLLLAGRFPGSIGQLLTGLTEGLFDRSGRLMEPILQRIPQLATSLAGKLSQGLFGIVTALIASVMLSARLPALRQTLQQRTPVALRDRYTAAVTGLKRALGGWLLAQMKLAAITFVVLLCGFFLLRIYHAPLWALLITLVDAFPVLGVGTVLLPWSLVALLQGQIARGLGLLGIYAVAWLLRSALEPRLVGRSLGLDPLLTLLAIYAGFRLWGIAGLLLAPMLAMAAVQVWKSLS